MNYIEIKNLKAFYNEKKVFDIDEIILEKGINYIIGKNGTGKSTFLKFLSNNDILFDYKFEYINLDRSTNNILPMVTQNPISSISKELTFLENLIIYKFSSNKFFFSLVSNSKFKKEIYDFLEEYSLMPIVEKLLYKKAEFLSGGEMQILSIVMRLLNDSKILLLDEPTASLDVQNTALIMSLIDKLKSKNYIIVIVTHDNNLLDKYLGQIHNF